MHPIKFLTPSLFMVALTISGCGNLNVHRETSEAASAINEASERTAEIENGHYTYELRQDGEQAKSEIKGEGAFVRKENGTDWYTQFSAGESGSQIKIFTEEAQQSGVRYQRLSTVDEHDSISNEEPMEEWQMLSEENSTFPLYLEELMTIELQEEDIESVEIRGEEEYTIYELTFTEEYRSSVIEENIEELEVQIAELSSEPPEGPAVAALEQAIEMQKNTTYSDGKVYLTIDESNVLVSILKEDTLESTTEDSTQITTSPLEITLTDYNEPLIEIETDI